MIISGVGEKNGNGSKDGGRVRVIGRGYICLESSEQNVSHV